MCPPSGRTPIRAKDASQIYEKSYFGGNAIVDLIVQPFFLCIMIYECVGRVLNSCRNVYPNSLEKCSIVNHNHFIERFG